MPIEPRVMRSRSIRQAILSLLEAVFMGSPIIAVRAREIYNGFLTGAVQFDRSEVDGEIADLVAQEMIEAKLIRPSMEAMPETAYKITAAGRDFVRAGFPWAEIDKFSGGQSL